MVIMKMKMMMMMIACIKVPAEDAGYGALEQAAVLNVEVNMYDHDGEKYENYNKKNNHYGEKYDHNNDHNNEKYDQNIEKLKL